MLAFSRSVLSRTRLPGRYPMAELVAKLFAPADKLVEGRIGDFAYQFDFHDELQRQMYFGIYDQAEMALMSEILHPGDVFFDIGANVGYYSFQAASLVGDTGEVHSFEPIPENALKIQTAVERNKLENVHVNQVAVGESEGTLELYLGDEGLGNSGWASIVSSERRPRALSVRMLSIDHYVAENDIGPVRLIKMDVEGAEPEVIAGMKLLLERSDAPYLLCEVNPWLLERRGLDSTAITQPLAAHGYRLYPVETSAVTEIDPLQTISDLTNLFCRKR
ncbi:MAG: FkbM family methyltransferase [Anaerolineae bacterium]|nr:FkbM family methyltransferase [Anaerolineae bacterium]